MKTLPRIAMLATLVAPLLSGLTAANAGGDATAPTLSAFTRAGNAGVTAPATIDISYTAADDTGGSGLANVSFIYSTPDSGSLAVSDADPAISGSIAAGAVDGWAAAGSYQLQQAVVQDAAGNRLTYLRDGSAVADPAASSSITRHTFDFSAADFTVTNPNQDVTVPTLTSVTPTAPATVAPGGSLSVTYAATDDGSGLISAQAEMVDVAGHVLVLRDNAPTGSGGALTATVPTADAGGAYELLTVTLVDKEGNTGYYLAGGGISRTPSGATGPSSHAIDFSGDGFTIPAVQTVLTATGSARTITYGGAARLAGRLVRTDSRAGVASGQLTVQVRKHGSTRFSTLGYVTTAADGSYTMTARPVWNADYRVLNPADAAYQAATTSVVSVFVRAKVSASLSAVKVRHGAPVAVYGSVAPSHVGQLVTIQRYVAGKWKSVASRKLDRYSDFAFIVVPSARGTYVYRIVKLADGDHAAAKPPKLTLSAR